MIARAIGEVVRSVALIAVLSLAGVSCRSSDSDADAGIDVDATSDVGSRSHADVSTCPPNAWCDCVCPPVNEGGVCICDNFSMPQCPAGAGGGTSCSAGSACMGCFENAGFGCNCADAGPPHVPDAAGPWWACVGSGYACMGGGI